MTHLSRYRLAILLLWLGMTGWAPAAVTAPANTTEAEIVELVRDWAPSVVAIHITINDVRMGPEPMGDGSGGGGSGFVVDAGWIVTNFHVVVAALDDDALETGRLDVRADATLAISYLDQPGQEFAARIHGANPDVDIALLELVNPEEAPRVPPLNLGNSDEVVAGQTAIAIGTPFGLHSTVTSGIVSAIEREQPGVVGIAIPFIQTDAAINPGNSGGPLFNSKGEVIGINNAILASPGGGTFIGVGFAVPINLLLESMDELRAGGLIGVAAQIAELPKRPRLGLIAQLSVEDYPPPLRARLNFPEHGVVVTEVTPGGPADAAGLSAPLNVAVLGGIPFPVGGDIIIGIEGEPVHSIIDLQQVILAGEAGETVTLQVWRDGQMRRVEVTLEVVTEE